GGTWIYLQELAPQPARGAPQPARGAPQQARGGIQENVPVQESESGGLGGKVWSADFQPIPGNSEQFLVTFHPHMAVFRRDEDGLVSTLEVCVAAEDPLEIRRLHLTNNTNIPRRLRLTSYGEVILTQQANDARHPAFNKMFIESEYLPAHGMLIFNRRPRSSKETPIFLGHMLVTQGPNGETRVSAQGEDIRYETDRYRFTGRGQVLRRPAALFDRAYLSGSVGSTLDPIFALGKEIDLPAHGVVRLTYLTFTAESRAELIEIANRYRAAGRIERAFNQADLANQSWLAQHNTGSREMRTALQVLSALIYPSKETRAPAETLSANRLGQSGLWRFGISGDYPVLLVCIDDPTQLDLVRELLNIHRFLHVRRFTVDLVILNMQQTDYGAELNGMLYRLAARTGSDQWLNQRGGVFVLHSDQMRPEERVLLETASRVVLNATATNDSVDSQLPGYSIQVLHLPELVPSRSPGGVKEADSLPPLDDLQFFNGTGGFSADGREYVIDLSPGRTTPAPWTNVIGYADFGFMVTESGSSCTWAVNSGENRLTPWSNDPVSDPTGEALYLRDEETGEVWTPTPLPAGDGSPYRTRHGAGYTTFEHHSHGLRQHLRLFAVPDQPLKIVCLRVENKLDIPRRITVTQYV
ncbi:MAG: hypothetical protein IH586_12995, partial [Anaerolineaceae bacterium]|nr:hypothetical protein [Anaerolineaceae bacterium]